MIVIKCDMYQTLAIAVVMLLIGTFLSKKVSFLRRFCIPAPVIGGLIFAIFTCICYSCGIAEFSFDETLRQFFMVLFFTSVGFAADLKMLKKGGMVLVILVIMVAVVIFCQNTLAFGLSRILGVSDLVGLCTGSISMIGGHGTSGAFGPILEEHGVTAATTICTAAATYGLIAGSLMGGPLGRYLIERKNLLPTAEEPETTEEEQKTTDNESVLSNYPAAVFTLVIAVGIGTIVSSLLTKLGITFPVYVGGLIVAAVMRNISELTGAFRIRMKETESFGNICLSLFLGVAMITLQIWRLADLALPLIIMLAAQTVLMFVFARFAVFNACGRNYDAAVITAGFCGFGLGATPNAMANMQSVCDRYVLSVRAYLMIPVVGTFFLDLINSLSITFFINIG